MVVTEIEIIKIVTIWNVY